MNIERVTSTVLSSYEYPNGGWVLVRVQTDDGVEGLGECFVPDSDGSGVFAAKEIIDRSLARVVLGQNVCDVRPIWESMYDVCRRLYDRRGLAIHSLSGIDMAVHDAAARTLGVPLYTLFGGKFRDRVRVYVSSIYVDPSQPEVAMETTRRYVAQGFTAIKYYGWPEFGEDLVADGSLLERIGEAAGAGTEVMLDLGRPRSLAEGVQVAQMIEGTGVNVRWWEEPFSSSDHVDDLAKLSERTIVPIAAGEQEITAFAFRDLIHRGAVDVVQPDLSWVGGPTEGMRIAELARLHNLPLVPHNWGTMVNFAASIHLVAVMPQGFLCEYPITARTPEASLCDTPSPMMTRLAKEPILVEDGYAHVPDGPGLGIELDEDIVTEHTCEA